jgi:hypothetical protein
MTRTDENLIMTSGEFAHLGEGSVAYLRKISSDDLRGRFPGLGEIAPGLELWALLPPTASRSFFRTLASGRWPAPWKTT